MSSTTSTRSVRQSGPRPTSSDASGPPADRDLVIDLVRVGAITAVVLGHWLVAGLERGDGGLITVNALGPVEVLRPVTWFFQVMPLFFVAGGAANHASWTNARRRGATAPEWVAGRLTRLVRPTLVLALAWAAAVAIPALTGFESLVVADAAWVAGVPLWFLAAYVPTIALAPMLSRLGDRAPVRVVAALAGATILADVVGIGAGVTPVRFLNLLAPWLLFQQLGFWWRENRLPAGAAAARWSLVFLGATVAATTLGPYPVSMVSVPGEALGNTSPPTVTLVLLGCTHLFAVRALLRPLRWVTGWRPAQAVLLVVGSSAMTVYLWHFTALVIVAVGALALGLPLAEVGGTAWWLAKPLWILASGVVLAGLIRVFRSFEAPWPLPCTVSTSKVSTRTVTTASFLFIAAAVRMTINGFHAEDLPLDVDSIGLGLVLGSVMALRNSHRPGMAGRRSGFAPHATTPPTTPSSAPRCLARPGCGVPTGRRRVW
ncbi:MAG: acyltransferase [Acidimicrobiales bacterium]